MPVLPAACLVDHGAPYYMNPHDSLKSSSMKQDSAALQQILKELQQIPGVGPSIAKDLFSLGINRIQDLKGKNPEVLYETSNQLAGVRQDRCLLYVFRCAVYFAQTARPDPSKLKWWNWKDKDLDLGTRSRRSAKRIPMDA